MRQLIMTVGFPRSGKTRWARKQGLPIVNPDSIRLAIHGQPYVQSAEPFVWAVAYTMVEALFRAGHERVILDACNNTRKRREEWAFGNWERVFAVVNTPAKVCIERTLNDDSTTQSRKGELLSAIERMEEQHEPVTDDEGPWRYVGSEA